MVGDGTLQGYIDQFSVTGLTSNPTIFEHAIGSDDVDGWVSLEVSPAIVDQAIAAPAQADGARTAPSKEN